MMFNYLTAKLNLANQFFKRPLALLVVALLLSFSAEATHYRYGNISYVFMAHPHPDSCTIEVTVNQAWRSSFFGVTTVGDVATFTTVLNLSPLGSGIVIDSDPVDITSTSLNAADDWFYGEFTTTFTIHEDSSYVLWYENCCRISTLANNSDAEFRAETVVTPCSGGNESPRATITPIVKLPEGVAANMFTIPAVDPDGDPLTFRLATVFEVQNDAGGGTFSSPFFSVTPGGMATFSTAATPKGSLHNCWVAIEDGKGSKSTLDFIVEVVDSGGVNSPPSFDYGVTPIPGPCIMAHPGDSVKFWVKASDPDSGQTVVITGVGIPPGAMFTPSLPSPGGNPDSVQFCWVPGPGDLGPVVMVFTAEDDSAATASTAICVDVVPDSVPIDTTCIPVDVVCESDTSWRKSTYTETAPWGGTWGGAMSLPGAGTYTMPVSTGQPYGYHSIDEADGAPVIIAPNNVTFYRKEMIIANPSDVEMRIRMSMDDGAEVYINGTMLVREENSAKVNWKKPVHDIHYDSDGTITNGYMGGQMFDVVPAVDLNTVLVAGANEVVVALYNLRGAANKGGFSFKLEAVVDCPQTDSCVSDSTWDLSTHVTEAPWGGDWSGVSGMLPADSTYTLKAMEGQPYPWGGMPAVPGSEPIKADNNVRFYRKCFEVIDTDSVDARIRMYMDDGAEIYLNGVLLVREENMHKDNWTGVYHDIMWSGDGSVDNGHMGGQTFDYVNSVDLDTVLTTGKNELVIALYNLRSGANKGGFSFRLDMTRDGLPNLLPYKNVVQALAGSDATLELYPNPVSNMLNLKISSDYANDRQVMLLDMSGKVLTQDVVSPRDELYRFDMNAYPSGMYIVRVLAGDAVLTAKVFKH